MRKHDHPDDAKSSTSPTSPLNSGNLGKGNQRQESKNRGFDAVTRPKQPPPAGASFLEMYGICNVLTGWLIRHNLSELAADSAASFSQGRLISPRCPAFHGFARPPQMHWRGDEFVCYQHRPPVRILVRHEFPTAPKGDVLTRTGEMLDYVWIVDPPHWEIRPLDMAPTATHKGR